MAVVIGAGGGLGCALLSALSGPTHAGQTWAAVLPLGRSTQPPLDFTDTASVQAAAQWVSDQCRALHAELRLLVVTSGFLHGRQGQPERSWSQLDPDYLTHVFRINAIGPALVMKHFLPLLPKRGQCVAAFMSAKVGSIGDNALGGWYGYRASKAALNQLVKTAAIELGRHNRQAICVALHPGTVDTPLSQPFAKTGLQVRTPQDAAQAICTVLQHLQPSHTGCLLDYTGQVLPF